MFQHYQPIEYICIDIANNFGLDKELFEVRVQWVKDHLHELESLADQADEKELYLKAVHALRLSIAGKPNGHLVALDATCSGIQIMSAITGCIKGADATGLISSKRADAYTDVTNAMNALLRLKGVNDITIPRPDIKQAVMTAGYGSQEQPKKIFGECDLLATFYQAAMQVAPAAFELMSSLLSTWRPMALSHNWVMPDNFHVNIKVIQKKEVRIEVDELNHSTFTTYVKINEGSKKGLANVANTIHSIDAYLLRTMIRRCSYKPAKVKKAVALISEYLLNKPMQVKCTDPELENLLNIYQYSQMADIRIIDYLNVANINMVPTELLMRILGILNKMLELGSSPVLTVHDAYRAHANHCNTVRYWYKEIMAELAESNILEFIVMQITGKPCKYIKKSQGLGDKIRNSNYAIC